MDWKKFEQGVEIILKQIKNSNNKFSGVYGIPRGGLILAVRLSHLLGLPLLEKLKENSLVVDDVADTGKTLQPFRDYKLATLYLKEQSLVKPDFYAFTTDLWVVFPWENSI